MQQQMAVMTLGSTDLERAKRFYANGFGWKLAFENPEIVFYQMNGFVLGLFLQSALETDMGRQGLAAGPGAYALAHNVREQAQVEPLMQQLLDAGGTLIRPADAPPHGGYRGYVADPDGHAWEVAWNPAWPISPEGYVTLVT
ncbi:VOC family protein [Devosia sp. XK-2]|uniref:VOC family protein n=1 Tax=Devosia sp. XK-2 TaxID=3126689 RepID=UPI0030D0C5D6